jgi:GNAT superfamily N-acetyltransferase
VFIERRSIATRIDIRPIRLPLGELAPLREEARRDGYRFVERLFAEWESGTNRFDGDGECLVGAFVDGTLVGIGGLNRDPFAGDAGTGRLRHLFVHEAWRRRGIGRALVEHLVAAARGRFDRLRLRSRDARAFYVRQGFRGTAEADATHIMELAPAPAG